MDQLFAEAFLEPAQHPVGPTVEYRYDEALSLAVLRDGRAYVEHSRIGETQTVTKAMGERDDDDRPRGESAGGQAGAARGGTGAHTAVRGGADDWAATGKETETVTLVRAEGIDWAAAPELDTVTRVRAEADDWAV
jgi:hypothetical protein